MAETNNKKTMHASSKYTCPLCEAPLNVDSSFCETRCEQCGMYVVNTDSEFEIYQSIMSENEKTSQNKEIIDKAINLLKQNKNEEALKILNPLIKNPSENPRALLVYVMTKLNLYSSKFDANAVGELFYVKQEEIDKLENYCNILSEYAKNNASNTGIQEQVNEVLTLKANVLKLSSYAYASNSVVYNKLVLDNKTPNYNGDYVKIVKEEPVKKITNKKEYREYLADPEPIPFPGKSGIKWVTITFWVLGVLALFSTALICGLWIDQSILASWNIDLSKYTFKDMLVPSGLGAIIIALWISWFAYWIIRKFKKIDDMEPVSMMWIRRATIVALIVSVVYLAWKIIAVAVCNNLGSLVDTGMSLASEKQKMYTTIIVVFSLIVLLIIFSTVNRQRFYDDMNNKPLTFTAFLRYAILALTLIGFYTLIILGIAAIVHVCNKNIVVSIFGSEATLVKQIVKIGLIVSACVFVVGLVIDMIWSSYERSVNEKEIQETINKNKENRQKNADNIKIIFRKDISSAARAKQNLEAFINLETESIKEAFELVDMKNSEIKTYDQIDKEIYKALLGKEPQIKQKSIKN